LLLKQDDNSLSKPSLIMPRSEYRRGNKFRINLEGKDRLIEMGSPIKKVREWVRLPIPN
jgi:hypothetical protein